MKRIVNFLLIAIFIGAMTGAVVMFDQA
ncbi:MAG: hypothetical protein FD147_2559, partial [Chloroflexi bacterium]